MSESEKPSKKIETDFVIGDYFPVPIDDFMASPVFKFDVYIKIGEKKFLKLAAGKSLMDREQMEKIRAKGGHTLYVLKSDYREYVGMNLKVMKKMEGEANSLERLKFMKGVVSIIQKTAVEGLLDKKMVEDSREFCARSFDLFSESLNIVDIFSQLLKKSSNEASHGTMVSVISSMIAKRLGWHSDSTAYKLMMAAILHDIGKKDLPAGLVTKPRPQMKGFETTQYQRHVTAGRDILLKIDGIPGDIAMAVYDHHEAYNGTGFPNGKKGPRIHPIAKVIKIANDFCNLAYPVDNIGAKTTEESLDTMINHKYYEYDSVTFQAFLELFACNYAPVGAS